MQSSEYLVENPTLVLDRLARRGMRSFRTAPTGTDPPQRVKVSAGHDFEDDMPIAERRSEMVADMMARTGIDGPMIERLVHAFYAKVRRDELLGPVFDARIEDWERHLGRMCLFWTSVALGSGAYQGSPMQVHGPLPVDAGHFDRWLSLFEETANEVCPPAAAEHFVVRAKRIAQSLELGIASHNGQILRMGQRYHRA